MTASAAPGMPSEELRERVAMICMEIEEDRSPDNVSEMFRVYGASDHDEGKRCPYGCGRCDVERARSNADRILALIRPAFEAKEREIAEADAEIMLTESLLADERAARFAAEAKLAQAGEVLEPFAGLTIGPEIVGETDLVLYKNAGRSITVGDVLRARDAFAAILALAEGGEG